MYLFLLKHNMILIVFGKLVVNVNFLIAVDKKQVADRQYYVIPPRGVHGQQCLWWQCAL